MTYKTSPERLAINRRYRERNREAVLLHKRGTRLRRLGLTPADLTRMLEEQDSRCAICGNGPLLRDGRALLSSHIDHCHHCGEVRALLCKRCNVMLGFIESDQEAFKKALLYYADHWIFRHPRAGRVHDDH